ncbi:hypothetical protein CVT26_003798 [Gymnopilus dilepis]|uniref:U6 small nuclear RNA (adenine-(43)-N(6))-methyltransferase n=1 Tax=Gymnopilus dilepis TaxID=231916 RepID=A0A409W1N1_9AGAR|nr:hypothetical protein CVT26_003798 [Gymnopilus dilepis]
MLRDFGVVLGIPEGRLCPPVRVLLRFHLLRAFTDGSRCIVGCVGRMNYVLWIQDIVYAHRAVLVSKSSSGQRKIRGLDIGTGSTAIYPLLACKLEPSWEMVGTELDDFSYEYALKNVESNNLQSSIRILKASDDKPILFPLDDQTFDFCMCNPPFYASKEEIERSAEAKELPPNAVCTGAEIEMIYPAGGEEGFVGRMVAESERFGVRCKWYTSMLGKMSSVFTIVGMLKERSITNYAITEFVQGQTRRWAVGWSFTDERLPDTTARIPNISPKHPLHVLMPSRNTLTQTFQLAPSASASGSEEAVMVKVVGDVLDALDGVSVSLVRASSTELAASAEVEYAGSAAAVGGAGGRDAPVLVEPRGGARFARPAAPILTPSVLRSPQASTPLSSLPETTETEAASTTWLVEATENTWSRAARRKNKNKSKVTSLHSEDQLQQQQQETPFTATSGSGPMRSAKTKTHRILREQQGDEEEARVRKTEASSSSPRPALTCSVRVSVSSAEATSAAGAVDASAVSYNGGGGDGEVSNAANAAEGACAGAAASRTLELELEFQWIYGSDSDRALFESFVGHVGRKVGVGLKRV